MGESVVSIHKQITIRYPRENRHGTTPKMLLAETTQNRELIKEDEVSRAEETHGS
jgi:hypothetical protein